MRNKKQASSFKEVRLVNMPAIFEIKMSPIVRFSVHKLLCAAVMLIYCCQPTLAVLTEDDAASSLVSGLRANRDILVSSFLEVHGDACMNECLECTVTPFSCSHHVHGCKL